MILKLIKYDVKKILDFLIYFYVISLGLAMITRLISIGNEIQFIYIIEKVFAGITYASIAQILVNIFTQTLRVFVCDFYKDESYLTHTLPVTKNQLLLSKYISSLIIIVISITICFIDLFVVLYTPEFFESLKLLINVVVTGFDIKAWLFVLIIALIILFQVCAMTSIAFSAVVKSNTYNSQRALKGFIWFFIYYFASGLVTLLTCVIVFAISGNLSNLFAQVMPQSAFITLLLVALICNFLYSFIFYFICNKLFTKGVNVD